MRGKEHYIYIYISFLQSMGYILDRRMTQKSSRPLYESKQTKGPFTYILLNVMAEAKLKAEGVYFCLYA